MIFEHSIPGKRLLLLYVVDQVEVRVQDVCGGAVGAQHAHHSVRGHHRLGLAAAQPTLGEGVRLLVF